MPKKNKTKSFKETWKKDSQLNKLLNERVVLQKNSVTYKRLSRLIKKRVNVLRNERISQEANEINEYANRRKIEDLYRSFKSDTTEHYRALEHPLERCVWFTGEYARKEGFGYTHGALKHGRKIGEDLARCYKHGKSIGAYPKRLHIFG